MALPSFFGRRNNFWDASDPAEMNIVTLFGNAPAGSYARDAHAAASTSVDWKETPTEHVFKVDLPGVRKEDVTVQIEDGRTLSIHGRRQKLEEVKETDTWHRVERSSGHFQRKFRLPESANLDQIGANMDSGVLTVTVPKVEMKKGQRVIEIGGHDKPAAATLENKAAESDTTAAAAPEHKATDGSTPAHGGQQ